MENVKKNLYLLLSAVMLAVTGMLLTGCDSSSESSYDGYVWMSVGMCKISGKICLDDGPNGAKYTFYDADMKQITTFKNRIGNEWIIVDIDEEKIDLETNLGKAVYYMVKDKPDDAPDRFYVANMNQDKDNSYTWTYYDPAANSFKSEYIALNTEIGGGKVNTREIMENHPQYISDNKECTYGQYPPTVWKGLDDFRKNPERNEGYTDWFIPSKDELSSVISVLGDFNESFKNADVWSSSGQSVKYGDAYMWWKDYKHMDPRSKSWRAKLLVVRSF